ncbi:MAG: histidine kinase [Brevibacillus sp.]|nr:histidine kinase [Brevibacillus sp.]
MNERKAGEAVRTIRGKLLFSFLVIIVTMTQVSYFLYHSSQLYINNYDEILRRFLLLNEITQTVRGISKTLSLQLVDPSEAYLNEYRLLKQKLLADRDRLHLYFTDPNNQLAVRNYANIIKSYLEAADEMLVAKAKDDTALYADLYPDLESMRRYSQEYAQSLYDIELTHYHQFYAETVSKNESLKQLSILMIICTTGLSILLVIWFSTGITRPITRLAQAAKRSYLHNGAFHFQPVEVNSRDEVEILAHAFNSMGRNIQQMVSEMNRKTELEMKLQKQELENLEVNHLLKEMELKALQNQIHPHFLFNTLNVISGLAYLEGAERSSELMVSLSNLLRYNLRRLDHPVTIAEEVDHVREYCRIQQTRFGERVQFSIDADPSLAQVSIPCLTIQPLVENAFIHGIEGYEEGAVIRIAVYRGMRKGRETAVVEIGDNGMGMSEETIQRLFRFEQIPAKEKHSTGGHSTGIGLRNVMKRLMLFEKTDDVADVIEMESVPGKGTTIRLFISMDKPVLLANGQGGERRELQADHR